jgi:hypothetical protein
MPTLKSILRPFETVAVSFGSENVSVTFRPQYLTPEFEDKLKGLNEEDKATEAFLSMFISLIDSWDLKLDDEDKSPIPITLKALKSIPYDVLGEILDKVQEAATPKSKKGANSDDTSLPLDDSDQFPTGTD